MLDETYASENEAHHLYAEAFVVLWIVRWALSLSFFVFGRLPIWSWNIVNIPMPSGV